MKRKLLLAAVAVAVAFVAGAFVAPAGAHYTAHCKAGWAGCKEHVIAPYRTWFLGPVGACESGSHSYNLRVGLRAISPGGKYRGRYQFGWPDWRSAGGTGDPAAASWIEQAYRAVVWLHMNGRGAWPNC